MQSTDPYPNWPETLPREPIAPPLPGELARTVDTDAKPRRLPILVWIAAGIAIVLLPAVLSTLWRGKTAPTEELANAVPPVAANPSATEPPLADPPAAIQPAIAQRPGNSAPMNPVPVLPPTSAPTEAPVVSTPVRIGPPAVTRFSKAEINQQLAHSEEVYKQKAFEFHNAIHAHLNQLLKSAEQDRDEYEARRMRNVITAFSAEMATPDEAISEELLEKLMVARNVREEAFVTAIRQAEALPDDYLVQALYRQLSTFMNEESRLLGNVLFFYPNSQYRIVNLHSSMALSVRGGGRQPEVVQMKPNPRDPAQQWRVLSPGTENARLMNCQSGHVLSLAEARRFGTPLLQLPDEPDPLSNWYLQHKGDHYLIQSFATNQFVSQPIQQPREQDDLQLVSLDLHPSLAQKWVFIRTLPALVPPRVE